MLEIPLGAIENGRVFLHRLSDNYDFSCEAGNLGSCADYHEAFRCFETMAEWMRHAQAALAEKDKAIAALREALEEIANGCDGRVGRDILPCRIARAALAQGADDE